MWLNIFSNRSFRDITQYPVFPWLLQFYDLNNKTLEKVEYRDFKLPMGMMELTEKGKNRKENYLNLYNYSIKEIEDNNIKKEKEKEQESLFSNFLDFGKNVITKIKDTIFNEEIIPYEDIELNEVPYIFGSHFSNYAYISHYLVRLFPFTLTAIEVQGDKFDAPDRLFININRSFISAVSQVSDLRELIPELFYLPEMFINLNQLNLGKLQKSKREDSTYQIFIKLLKKNDNDDIFVNDVLLPCDNNPYKFIYEHRKKLEESNNIDNWIDLFFGKYAIYDNAKEHNNLYMNYCYYDFLKRRVKKGMIKEEDKQFYFKLFDLGFNPIPILKNNLNGKRNTINSEMKLYEMGKSVLEKHNEEENIKLINYYEGNNNNNIINIGNENYKIYGSENGNLYIFNVKDKNNKLYKIIQNHYDKIIDINYNKVLNLIADISNDNYLNIYSIPQFKLIRSIYINIESDDNLNKIFLSAFPLSCIIIQTKKKLISYSINGKLLKEIEFNFEIKEIVTQNYCDIIKTKDEKKFNLPFLEEQK